MGHVDLSQITFFLPDGRPLLDEVSFRVGEGATVALIGPNGAGKTTLLRIISGDLDAHEGAVTRSGGLGVMRQFIGKTQVEDESTVRDLLVSVAPTPISMIAVSALSTARAACAIDDEPSQFAYAQALADWGDVHGYEQETTWDEVTMAALGGWCLSCVAVPGLGRPARENDCMRMSCSLGGGS